MKVLLLSSKSYDFVNDGKELKGVKLSYLNKEKADNVVGYPPIQSTISNQTLETLNIQEQNVPGIYDVDFAFVPGKGNAPTVQISGLKFVSKVDIDKLF